MLKLRTAREDADGESKHNRAKREATIIYK